MGDRWTYLWSTDTSLYFTWIEFTKHSIFRRIDYTKLPGNEHRNVLCYAKNGFVERYGLADEVRRAAEHGTRLFDRRTAEDLFAAARRAREHHDAFVAKVRGKEFAEASNDEILRLFIELVDTWGLVINHFRFTRPEFLVHQETLLRETIRKALGDERLEERFALLTTPAEVDPIGEEEIAIRRLVLEAIPTDERLLAHALDYPFLFPNTFTQGEALHYLKIRVQRLVQEGIGTLEREADGIEERKRALHERQERLLKDIGDDAARHLSWLLKECALERLRLEGCWAGIEYAALPLVREAASRVGLPPEEFARTYRLEEVEAFLRKGARLPALELELRKAYYLVRLRDGVLSFHSGREAKDLARDELGRLIGDVAADEAVGACANPGKAQGTARLVPIRSVSDIVNAERRFMQGDILITQAVQPNMIFLAKKAGAIVTDEGGVVSHAAMIARELGIPCIVGTGIATKAFREGETVELDAGKATVRRIVQS
ncbi:hypothetical protein JXB02_04660 [Candidatus Woesearchaeota archaeon]|nr:hypothetical protein [Candidatus Woesearchaeota archaeon]